MSYPTSTVSTTSCYNVYCRMNINGITCTQMTMVISYHLKIKCFKLLSGFHHDTFSEKNNSFFFFFFFTCNIFLVLWQKSKLLANIHKHIIQMFQSYMITEIRHLIKFNIAKMSIMGKAQK